MEHGRGYVDVVLVWLMLCSCGSILKLSQSSGTLGRRIFFLMIYGFVINQFAVVELSVLDGLSILASPLELLLACAGL